MAARVVYSIVWPSSGDHLKAWPKPSHCLPCLRIALALIRFPSETNFLKPSTLLAIGTHLWGHRCLQRYHPMWYSSSKLQRAVRVSASPCSNTLLWHLARKRMLSRPLVHCRTGACTHNSPPSSLAHLSYFHKLRTAEAWSHTDQLILSKELRFQAKLSMKWMCQKCLRACYDRCWWGSQAGSKPPMCLGLVVP